MTASPRLFDRLIAAWHERAIVLKAMSFAAVGVVNAAVDFGVFSFAYYYLELPIVTANVMAWIVAVSGSYVMNSLTTFARESGRELRAKAYFTFMISQVAGLARQHHHRLRRVLFHAGAARQGAGDRRKLSGQLLAVALRRVSQAKDLKIADQRSFSSRSTVT